MLSEKHACCSRRAQLMATCVGIAPFMEAWMVGHCCKTLHVACSQLCCAGQEAEHTLQACLAPDCSKGPQSEIQLRHLNLQLCHVQRHLIHDPVWAHAVGKSGSLVEEEVWTPWRWVPSGAVKSERSSELCQQKSMNNRSRGLTWLSRLGWSVQGAV